eukprot:GHVU01042634.1.p2 GENE.GHVU01042634.1~~GHVU01042634.1.p2  ORF type:complete len:132 (+),score=16.04 GHVU01042634.1:411-806(+)
MGKLHVVTLSGKLVYCCKDCGIHLSPVENLVSTSFRGRTGTAWLFCDVVNVSEGQFEDRWMTTGLHTIVDIYCNICFTNLGWRYEEAFDEAQKYKRGKYILEKALLTAIERDGDGQEVSVGVQSDAMSEAG